MSEIGEGSLRQAFEKALATLKSEFVIDGRAEMKLSELVVKTYLDVGGMISTEALAKASIDRWLVICAANEMTAPRPSF